MNKEARDNWTAIVILLVAVIVGMTLVIYIWISIIQNLEESKDKLCQEIGFQDYVFVNNDYCTNDSVNFYKVVYAESEDKFIRGIFYD